MNKKIEIKNKEKLKRLSALQNSCLYVTDLTPEDFKNGCPVAKALGITKDSGNDFQDFVNCIRCDIDYEHIRILKSIIEQA